MSVIHNTQQPESTLKKKLNSICYHTVCEAVTMEELLMRHIDTNTGPADLLMKVIPGGAKQRHLAQLFLYDLANHD